jgi:predicted phage terminase large subunit-like protein
MQEPFVFSFPHKSEVLGEKELKTLHFKYRATHKHDFPTWLDVRDRLRKDLFFLLTVSPLGAYPGGEAPQRELCDQFVKKDFDGVYVEGFTLHDVHMAIDRQPREKEAIILAPRGGTKSVIDCADVVQWLLNCPDIRILILTGKQSLSLAFLSDVKAYFFKRDETPATYFQALFPEYILTGYDGYNAQPLQCPARRFHQKEPSVWTNSITASLSGWHCDVKKGDDIVDDENCNSQETRANINDKYDGTADLLDEWGFADHIGTRYFPNDWYGMRLKKKAEAPFLFFKRACWTVKPDFANVPLTSLTPEMVELWFPAKLTWQSLKQKMRNERKFRCQQLNEPAGSIHCDFQEDVLRAHFIQRPAVPLEGKIYIAWDWALSDKKTANYSACAVGKVCGNELYILEIVCDRFKPSELAFKIVDMHRRYQPEVTLIEESNGADFLKLEIARCASRFQVPIHIKWQSPREGKQNRIKSLETLLAADRLWFVTGEWIDKTVEQFTNYTGERNKFQREDDIPDAVSYLQLFVPVVGIDKAAEELARKLALEAEKAQAEYDRYFGVSPLAELPEEEDDDDGSANPLDAIFGGNGLRV